MPRLLASLIVLPALLLTASCGGRAPEPDRVAQPSPPRAESSWSPDDSRALADAFVEAAAREGWSSRFRDRTGRAAILGVAPITDRSDDHVPVQQFAETLAAALDASEKFDAITSGRGDAPPDFRVQGRVSGAAVKEGGATVRYFAVDLQVVDAAGDPVWPFSIERRVVDAR